MTRVSKKWSILSLAVVLILTLSLTGCFSDNPTTQDIIDKWKAAEAEVNTYAFDMDMIMQMSVTSDKAEENQTISMQMDGSGVMDNANNQMKMNIDLSTEMPEQGSISIPIDYYLINNCTYFKMSLPMIGGQWMKMNIDPSQYQSMDQMEMQLEFLQNAVQVTQTGTEEINGADCYVMVLTPDLTKITDWFKSLQQTMGSESPSPDLSQFDLSKIIKEVSIKQWINTKSYLINKAEIKMVMSINESDFATPTEESSNGKFDMQITGTMNFQDYNQPVTITLPAEAETAQEIPVSGK